MYTYKNRLKEESSNEQRYIMAIVCANANQVQVMALDKEGNVTQQHQPLQVQDDNEIQVNKQKMQEPKKKN